MLALISVSDSDSHKSSPSSSAFLSPPNKVVPERYAPHFNYEDFNYFNGLYKKTTNAFYLLVFLHFNMYI